MENNRKVIQSAALNEREYLHKIFLDINGIKTDMRNIYIVHTIHFIYILPLINDNPRSQIK